MVVTLEDWHIFLPTLDKLKKIVVHKLTNIAMTGDVLDEMPFSIWYVGDLEAGMQIANEIGVRRLMDGKIHDPEMSRWEWQAYMAQMFEGKFSRKEMFRDDYDAIFEKIIGDQIAEVAQPRGGQRD